MPSPLLRKMLYLCSLIASVSSFADYRAEKIMSGLMVPWGLAFLSDSEVLVTERNGDILLLDIQKHTINHILNVPNVAFEGQGGLLDIALSPKDPNIFYFTYSKQTKTGSNTTLAIAHLDNNQVSDWRDILVTQSNSNTTRHFGSRIAFIGEYLYFSVGDRGIRPNGQNLSTHAGSILRLKLDGSIPSDNPFVSTEDAQPQIWSYGHRNPQGLFYDQPSQTLWEIEHGPRGGDEINLILKGANYGWPKTSYGKEYWGPVDVGDSEEAEGIESPKKVYTPSIAPSGLLLYRGDRYPKLNGKLLAGALKLTHINVITIDKHNNAVDEIRLLESLKERIRDIKLSPDGWIYFTTDTGNIYKLVPES